MSTRQTSRIYLGMLAMGLTSIRFPALTSLVVLILVALLVAQSRRPTRRASTWTRAWDLVALGLVVRAGGVAVAGLLSATLGASIAVTGSLVMAAGVSRALKDRTSRGRAADVTIEIALAGIGTGFVLLVLARGSSSLDLMSVVGTARPLLDLMMLWLLSRVAEVVDIPRRAVRWAMAATGILAIAGSAHVGALLADTGARSATIASTLLLWGLCIWAAVFANPELRREGAALPVTGLSMQTTNLVTIIAPVLLGPLAMIWHLVGGQYSGWVVGGGMLLPLLSVAQLLRQVHLRTRRAYLAQHDPLTGLPNNQLFNDQLEVEFARQRREGGGFTVMFLDLDRFKSVNDSLGHDAGDELLRQVARRIASTLSPEHTLARIGGDEFTVLLPTVLDIEVARAHADAILDRFIDPFRLGSRDVYTRPSIGISFAPMDGDSPSEILKNADTAMYRAKNRGAGRVELYTSEMSQRARLRLALENHLRRAIDSGQLTVHYQPKVDARSQDVIGYEALVRWNHPTLGLIYPSSFVRLAEETGLISELGRWVMHRAAAQARAWADDGRPTRIAVNISPRQLKDMALEDLVTEAIETSGIEPWMLEIEITESALLDDPAEIRTSLEAIRALGVAVALDDFGTGYSGLSYLTQIPLDSLKLDRSFVMDIEPGRPTSPVVEAVLALASTLGLAVIAEGVETEYQAAALRMRGVSAFQGYLHGRPAPAVGEIVEVATAIDPVIVNRVLTAVCAGSTFVVPTELDEVLALLEADDQHDTEPTAPLVSARRLAVGTLAGLAPLTGGLAGAGALPPVVQHVTAEVFNPLGFQLPSPAASATPDDEAPVLAIDVTEAAESATAATTTEPAASAPVPATPVDAPEPATVVASPADPATTAAAEPVAEPLSPEPSPTQTLPPGQQKKADGTAQPAPSPTDTTSEQGTQGEQMRDEHSNGKHTTSKGDPSSPGQSKKSGSPSGK